MTKSWIESVIAKVVEAGAAVRVTVIKAEGSTPREAGAAMIVAAQDFEGTIGGGTLEHRALAEARDLLPNSKEDKDAGWLRQTKIYPLGPSLGQCCGGSAQLLFERFGAAECLALQNFAASESGLLLRPLASGTAPTLAAHPEDLDAALPRAVRRIGGEMLVGGQLPEARLVAGQKKSDDWFVEPLRARQVPLFLYGAGHVGRAVVQALTGLAFDIHWVDTAPERFPGLKTGAVECISAADPSVIAAAAPANAFHVVMTYSHPMDLAICHAVLEKNDFAYLGLIGSKTKRARFVRRLQDAGISEAVVERMVCPIGLPGIRGKEPAVIAVSLAADLLQRLQKQVEKPLSGSLKRPA